MLKKLICVSVLLLLLSGCEKKTYPVGRLYMPTGNFSYVTPDGWFRRKLTGIDFLIASTNADYGIKPNIFVEKILPKTQLDTAVEQTYSKKKESLNHYQIEQKSSFTTQSGLDGIKITARHTNRQELPISTFQYLIQDSDRVISLTCTCAEAVKLKYEPLFDTAIKSLQSESQK